jgi:CubicO group peptidase (beta-lactamase class C family)
MLGIVLSRALKGRTLADYIPEKIWQTFGMESDTSWIVDKAGIERGGCCLSIMLRDYARLGMFMDEGGRAGGVDVLPEGWIHDAWTPQPSEPNEYTIGYGYYWQIRQDGGYEAVGAYGQSAIEKSLERKVVTENKGDLVRVRVA